MHHHAHTHHSKSRKISLERRRGSIVSNKAGVFEKLDRKYCMMRNKFKKARGIVCCYRQQFIRRGAALVYLRNVVAYSSLLHNNLFK